MPSPRYSEAWEQLEKALDAFLKAAEQEEGALHGVNLSRSETDKEIWIAYLPKKDGAEPSRLRKVGIIGGAGDDVCIDTVVHAFPAVSAEPQSIRYDWQTQGTPGTWNGK